MTLLFAIRLALVAVCFGVSAFLAFRRTEGWGWFLFVGFLLVPNTYFSV